jgi:ribosomal peptide maturation radical SAM protein 1
MPWASIKHPLLGIGVLTNKLNKSGYDASSYYPNINFSNLFELNNYEFFAENPSLYPLAEYLFAANYFSYNQQKIFTTLKYFFGNNFLEKNDSIIQSVINLCETVIPEFLKTTANHIMSVNPDIIGFSSTFNQIFPSLAVAKHIKKTNPEKVIIFGGASFHGEMGVEYSKSFKDVADYVFTGDSDNSLPMFIEYLNGLRSIETLDGIVKGGEVYNEPVPVNMNDVFPPDYDDYFVNLKSVYPSLNAVSELPFESSRGCWWGQKSHCIFCGLNNLDINYRFKTDDAIIEELIDLSSKYQTLNFLAADNILNISSYKSLLPRLAAHPVKFNLFYEVKANMQRTDVYMLIQAGIKWIQPGIESFSSNTLKCMRKGITAIQNIQLLKYCKEYGINACYNILTGFNGETVDDYENMISTISKIKHLQPPSGLSTDVQIHRFSSMYNTPQKYGLENMMPCRYYNEWFPKDFIDINKIAYFFEATKTNEIDGNYKRKLNVAIEQWLNDDTTVYAELGTDFVIITIKEQNKLKNTIILDYLDSLLFMLTDRVSNIYTIKNKISTCFDGSIIEERLIKLTGMNIILNECDQYLNIIPFKNYIRPRDLDNWLKNMLNPVPVY